MKRLSYGLSLLIISLPVILIASFIIYPVSGKALIVFLSSSTILLAAAFILYFRYVSRLSFEMKRTSDRIKNESEKFEEYDEKIIEIGKIKEEFSFASNGLPAGAEITEIADAFNKLIERLLAELHTAKVFKVNRNEFLGNVAHEMRTPIFAIQLSLETLADGAIDDDKVNRDFLNKALNQSNRLKSLVDDLISISRFEAGIKLSRRYFAINQLVQETIHELQGLASRGKISLQMRTELKNGATVFADSDKIKQVLVNLIDNSIKYTPEGGTVTVTTVREEKQVRITVEDTGAGIPKGDLPRIFERFYRVDKTRSRDVGGSGLGLSIVKHLIELHDSQIKADSVEGKGTVFEFTLPA